MTPGAVGLKASRFCAADSVEKSRLSEKMPADSQMDDKTNAWIPITVFILNPPPPQLVERRQHVAVKTPVAYAAAGVFFCVREFCTQITRDFVAWKKEFSRRREARPTKRTGVRGNLVLIRAHAGYPTRRGAKSMAPNGQPSTLKPRIKVSKPEGYEAALPKRRVSPRRVSLTAFRTFGERPAQDAGRFFPYWDRDDIRRTRAAFESEPSR
jgi:hypothetical protein